VNLALLELDRAASRERGGQGRPKRFTRAAARSHSENRRIIKGLREVLGKLDNEASMETIRRTA
jgi:hypothetical protein